MEHIPHSINRKPNAHAEVITSTSFSSHITETSDNMSLEMCQGLYLPLVGSIYTIGALLASSCNMSTNKRTALRLAIQLDQTDLSRHLSRITRIYVVAKANGTVGSAVVESPPKDTRTEVVSTQALQYPGSPHSFEVLLLFERGQSITFTLIGQEGGAPFSQPPLTNEVPLATGMATLGEALEEDERLVIPLESALSSSGVMLNSELVVEALSTPTLTRFSFLQSAYFQTSFRNSLVSEFAVANVRATEISFETVLSYTIPLSLTKQVYLKEQRVQVQRWQAFLKSVRTAQCAFNSEAEAAREGHVFVAIRVVSAESLCQTQRLVDVGVTNGKLEKQNLGVRVATGMNNLISSASAKVSQKLNSAQVKSGQEDGKRLCNSYVVVSYLHPGSKQRVVLGRTNTEYRSKDAFYGTNKNKNLCDHSKAQAEHVAYGHTRLMKDNFFGFYVPALGNLEFNFEVFHERFSVARGVTPVPMMSRTITLEQLLATTLPHVSLDLFQFEVSSPSGSRRRPPPPPPHPNASQGVSALGTLVISVCLNNSSCSMSLPREKVVLLQNKLLYAWDANWISNHLKVMERDLERMDSAVAELETWILESRSLKPSTSKKAEELATVPTNLHIGFFGMERGVWEAHTFTTAGIPADHTDLTSKNSIMELREQQQQHRTPRNVGWSPCYPDVIDQTELSKWDPIELEGNIKKMQNLSIVDQRLLAREWRVMSQALTIVVTSVLAKIFLEQSLNRLEWWLAIVAKIGVLVTWESLVSSQGKELAMTLDAIGATDKLNGVLQLKLCFLSDANGPPLPFVHVAKADCVEVRLQGSDAFGLSTTVVIPVFVAVFTQGINEVQTVVNATNRVGTTSGSSLQNKVNRKSLRRVTDYWHQAKHFLPLNLGMLDALTAAVEGEKRSTKDVGILLSASDVGRDLNACRVTCCKSGKDRTAMSVTLECARILVGRQSEEESLLKYASLFREHGVRLRIAERNVGRPLYSFNALQRKLLPKIYRPPLSTIQDFYLSVTARDS